MTERILITGGAGFIGSNFIRYLLAKTDWQIISLDRIDEAGTLQRLIKLSADYPERLQVVWHDLRSALNPSHFSPLRGELQYIVHMAAGSHVDRSIADPTGYVLDNVLGTANILEYTRHHQSDARFLYFSTDEVFGPAPNGVAFDEHARWEPNNPYAATKAGGEALCPAYAHQYGVPITVTHCTNIFGEHQYREKFIPICIERIAAGRVVQIHARDDIPATRYYVHVDNVSSAVLTLLRKGGVIGGPDSGRYNISGDFEYSNLDVAKKIAGLLGKELHYELVEDPPGRPKPDMRYSLNGAKLRSLGWRPEVDFDSGLARTIEWYVRSVLGEPVGGRAA